VLADEDQPERGDAKVDTFQAGRDRAEQQAGQAGQADCEHHPGERWQAQAANLVCARVDGFTGKPAVAGRAHGEEECVPEGELPGRTDEDVQADRPDRGAEHGEAGPQPELLQVVREHE
jgi:hypothetical protein